MCELCFNNVAVSFSAIIFLGPLFKENLEHGRARIYYLYMFINLKSNILFINSFINILFTYLTTSVLFIQLQTFCNMIGKRCLVYLSDTVAFVSCSKGFVRVEATTKLNFER